jgi:hypothetical protein
MECSDMPFIRITWVIALILSAATLPAGAQALPKTAESENRTPDENQSQDIPRLPTNDTDENNDDSPSTFQVIQTADMWNGGTTRTLSKGTVPIPSVNCISGAFAGQLTTPNLPTSAYSEISIPSIRLQRRWLASRYAHAPPQMPSFA